MVDSEETGRAVFDWLLELRWADTSGELELKLREWHRSFAWLPVRLSGSWFWLTVLERRGWHHMHEYGEFGFEYRVPKPGRGTRPPVVRRRI